MSVSPKRALLVIDVQNEYRDGNLKITYPPIASSLANITLAMDAAQAAAIPVIIIRHLAPETAPIFAQGGTGADLMAEIAERPHDLLVTKSKASALSGTDLGDWLRSHGIDTLTIVGYMTHNCDDSTARQAFHEGWKVELLSDATGSLPYANDAGKASAEEIHRVFTVVMHTGFAAVASTAAWIEAVQTGTALPVDSVYGSNRRALL